MRRLISIFVMTASCIIASAQSQLTLDFKEACDSLNTLLTERTSVKGELKLKSVMKRGDRLDFYFTESLGDYPLHDGDVKWLRSTLQSLFPEQYVRYALGEISSRKVDVKALETPHLTFNGNPAKSRHKTKARHNGRRIVTELGSMNFGKGLSDRTIALWQSHGMYFNEDAGRWTWQRPCLFHTVEDMFTRSFVLPYLVPMLENAGAYVMIPRERDLQTNEVIADNDTTCGHRGQATYIETGNWSEAGTGFADLQKTYSGLESPFVMGTARKAYCTDGSRYCKAEWRPEIPERGMYAVYVSYVSLPESTEAAHYTVRHMGGENSFIVNQKSGGGTWVYLGTFEFDKGDSGYVVLDSKVHGKHKVRKGEVVTADAVRFGGGMGNIAREPKDSTMEAMTSGMPRSAEGARYWLQWAGAPAEIFHPEDSKNDYMDDFMCRGDWVDWMSGGSAMNPERQGKGVHIDLSFGFHSDAGITPNDSIVGTLAIYTSKSERNTRLPGGESRMTSREYADIVQSQLVHDLRNCTDTSWTRRQIWDRGYRESRTPSCPSMLIELLSHQNFADMKHGLDPSFRFIASRAIYKGMLKYLSNRYGVPYAVQPLPVTSMGIRLDGKDKAVIEWRERPDKLEPTAQAEGFILYSRIDDRAFDNGKVIGCQQDSRGRYTCTVDITPGHIYSFRIAAYNEGGISFPSETISAGIPAEGRKDGDILIINNFDRVSAPDCIDTPTFAGFDSGSDGGVPYISDIAYIGEMYEFRRNEKWMSNERPGFGASYTDYAGRVVAGNTFDYPFTHGKAIMNAGHAFYSCSSSAVSEDNSFLDGAWSTDIICGKQKDTVFTESLQKAIMTYAGKGGNILVSGAFIGRDGESSCSTKKFMSDVLGYKWITGHASRTGYIGYSPDIRFQTTSSPAGKFTNVPNDRRYCVESPDGLSPTGTDGKVIMRYTDSGISAGIRHIGKGHRTVCLGFPIEALEDEESVYDIISATLDFFKR